LNEVNNIVANHHQVAKDWKNKTGGKVIGYLNLNLPEELIYAAGILPVRVIGSHEIETITDGFMWNAMHCVSARDCLAQALQDRYDYLDGMVEPQGCPHTLQAYYSWQRESPVSYSYELYVPAGLNGKHAQACLREEIADFKASLEGWTGKTISNEKIDDAIKVYNRTRQLIKTISELRKSASPVLSGSEFMEIALAGMLTDKREYNKLLVKILDSLTKRKGQSGGVRVMLAGSCNTDIELLRLIESMGIQIVVDDHSTSGRYYMTEVVAEDDRLNALAAAMIRRPRCALHDLPDRTCHQHLLSLAKEYNAEGVIFLLQKHCDSQQFDLPKNKATLEENGIPAISIELDFVNPVGQMRTRIEAFVEMLQGRAK
jgi:benzoyl-CoA reductase subunit C